MVIPCTGVSHLRLWIWALHNTKVRDSPIDNNIVIQKLLMEPKSPSKAKLPISPFFHQFKTFKLVTTIVIIALLILISYYFIHNPVFPTNNSYFTVVLDCGSSGTRVNVYEWIPKNKFTTNNNNNNMNSEFPILLHTFPDNLNKLDDRKDGCAYHCMQTEPGLDKFVGNASGVKDSLEPLIRRAEKWVPYEKHKRTPIFVLATAGLRRLDQESAERVLDDVEAVVKLHEFKYRKDWIRVLSGEEEGYYGWIALNHHMGVFGNSSRLSPTLGVLDLGGSSLQVATEINQPMVSNRGVFGSKIGSFDHRVVAASLPAFGLNEAFDKTVVMLRYSQGFLERDVGSFEIRHPCLGYEFTQNYSCHGCFEGNLTKRMRKNDKFFIKLVGEPNWEKCKLLARAAAVNLSSSSDWSKLSVDSYCTGLSSINGENMLNLVGKSHSSARFHALSGFFAVYNLLNMNPSTNLSKIWEKGQELCSRSLSGLTKMPISQKYADFLCFRLPYVVSLLENTLCVGDKDIIFGPSDVSWTLGAALVEGKDLWLSDSYTYKDSVVSFLRFKRMIFSPHFLFIILAFLLFVVYYSQIKLPMLGRKVASLPSYIGPKRRPT